MTSTRNATRARREARFVSFRARERSKSQIPHGVRTFEKRVRLRHERRMAKKSTRKSTSLQPAASYWQKRIGSKEFRKQLIAALRVEIELLAGRKVSELIDARKVSEAIEDQRRLVPLQAVSELAEEILEIVEGYLKKQTRSMAQLLGRELLADIEKTLNREVVLSRHAEEFVARLMEQEFVRSLFTDIIYTAIVSFNERVNPFFGSFTVTALRDQIKGFIHLVMPMLVKQATAFAVQPDNQALLIEFTRAIVRQLLNEPLSHLSSMVSAKSKKAARPIVGALLEDGRLEALARQAVLVVWEELYRRIRNRRIGDLIGIAENATWLAEEAADFILFALSRPLVLDLLARETSGRT